VARELTVRGKACPCWSSEKLQKKSVSLLVLGEAKVEATGPRADGCLMDLGVPRRHCFAGATCCFSFSACSRASFVSL